MAGFDPSAWLAEYEAVGGAVHLIQGDGKLWESITYPRDEVGRGRRLFEELHSGNASGADGRRRRRKLFDYIEKTRGAVVAPARPMPPTRPPGDRV